MEDTYAPYGKSAPRSAKSATVPWRPDGVIVTRLPKGHFDPGETATRHRVRAY
jgi:hypothetical protein